MGKTSFGKTEKAICPSSARRTHFVKSFPIKKLLISLLACLLVGTTLFENVGSIFGVSASAESLKTLYVSEVKIGTKKSLLAEGYQVDDASATGRYYKNGSIYVNGNSSKINGDGMCIGYKTTTNPDEAITDLSVMDMYGGYNQMSYMEILSDQQQDMAAVAKKVQTAATEFKAAYEAGSAHAAVAYELLNYLYVPAETYTEEQTKETGKQSIPEMKLGDYLTSDEIELDEDSFLDLVFICSSVVTSYIYSQLCYGVADDDSEDTWLTRACNNGPFVLKNSKKQVVTNEGTINAYYEENLDGKYLQRSIKLYESIKAFADDYNEACKRNGSDEAVIEVTKTEAEAVEQDELDAIKLDITELESTEAEEVDNADSVQDSVVLGLYNALNARDENGDLVYWYDEDEEGNERSIGDFFVDIGSRDLENDDDAIDTYRLLYPLIMAQNGVLPLTEGQENMLFISGFEASVSLALGGVSTDEILSQAKEAAAEMLSYNNNEAVSVWFNVNKEIYEADADGCYWTSKLARITAAKGRYDLLTETSNYSEYTTAEKLKDAMVGVGAVAFTANTVASILSVLVGGLSTVTSSGSTVAAVAAAYWAGETVTYSTLTCVSCVVAEALSVVAAVAIVIIVVMALVYLILDIINEKSSDLEYTDIPEKIYDYKEGTVGNGAAVQYSFVTVSGLSSPSPKNIFSYYQNNKCFPWVCVYYTKDKNAGNPITLEMSGSTVVTPPFVSYYEGKVIDSTSNVTIDSKITSISSDGLNYLRYTGRCYTLMQVPLKSYSDSKVGEGYLPVHAFEEKSQYNFAYYGSDGFSGDYTDRLKNLNFATNIGWYMHQEEMSGSTQDGKYISDIQLFSETTIEAARNAVIISKDNLVLVDVDLTPSAKVHTYIGYQTTDDAAQALTDIRVTYASGINPVGGEITLGGSKYGCCGNVGDLCLLETSSSLAGTPILADGFTVSDTQITYGGFEPVNLFCGGPALNFNAGGNDWKAGFYASADRYDKARYIYFMPSTAYPADAEDAEEYIGGLAFFSGTDIDSYIEDTGWKVFSDTDISGHQYEGLKENTGEYKTVLCYTTTTNPYRAVYGITQYTCEPRSENVSYNVAVGGCGYVACDVFQQGGSYIGSSGRTIRYSHAYRSSNYYEGTKLSGYYDDAKEEKTDRVGTQEAYETEDGKLGIRDVTCEGLFVTGNYGSQSPLKVSELSASASAEYDAAAQTPVRSITDWYSETGANLGYVDQLGDKFLNIFQNYGAQNILNEQLYLYINRADTARGKFVSSVTVSYSGDGYYDEDGKHHDTSLPIDTAVLTLAANGPGQLIKVNLAGDNGVDSVVKKIDSSYQNTETAYIRHAILKADATGNYGNTELIMYSEDLDYSDEVAYIWVTYTNSMLNNLSDIRILESDSKNASKEIVLEDGSTASLCGDSFRVNNGKTYYSLYAIYGLSTRITNVSVGDTVFHNEDWTTVSVDGTASTYTTHYIYAEHYRRKNDTYFITDVFTASGATEDEAQKNLLSSGCRYCYPYNLKPGQDIAQYLGYIVSTDPEQGYAGFVLSNNEQNDAVTEILVGKSQYTQIGKNLNEGVPDAIISLYGTRSELKAHEADTEENTEGHYICGIMFWSDKALDKCFSGSDEEVAEKVKAYLDGVSEDDREMLEHFLYDADGNVCRMNIVTDCDHNAINCNLGAENFVSKNAETADVYMFVQYSDNYYEGENSFIGSLFASGNYLWVSGALLAVLGAAAFVIVKRKKKQNSNTEQSGDNEV